MPSDVDADAVAVADANSEVVADADAEVVAGRLARSPSTKWMQQTAQFSTSILSGCKRSSLKHLTSTSGLQMEIL